VEIRGGNVFPVTHNCLHWFIYVNHVVMRQYAHKEVVVICCSQILVKSVQLRTYLFGHGGGVHLYEVPPAEGCVSDLLSNVELVVSDRTRFQLMHGRCIIQDSTVFYVLTVGNDEIVSANQTDLRMAPIDVSTPRNGSRLKSVV
jgi:hypothetical protein